MTSNYLSKISTIMKSVASYGNVTIEASVIDYVQKKTNVPFSYEGELDEYKSKANPVILELFEKNGFVIQADFIAEFFEALLEKTNIIENGIVFTPEYIARYIFKTACCNQYDPTAKILDPSCGCGVFLTTAAYELMSNTGADLKDILENNIYGLELDKDNARRCKIVLNLLLLIHGEKNEGIKLNIVCTDSLKCKWTEVFGIKSFDYIIGNPPYVNTHDMTKETASFLKKTFSTTRAGVYNIFYAFIEHAMSFLSDDGALCYIVPNNFLTIKSAYDLRKFIVDNGYLNLILDFANNMVFKPVRTYNCIIRLTPTKNESVKYYVMENTENIDEMLQEIEFDTIPEDKLDVNAWKLIDKATRENISRIENQVMSIKPFIHTGIATLRDEVYMVNKNESGYYKSIDGYEYRFEEELIKRLYKTPEIRGDVNLEDICRYILFPYRKGKNGYEIIPEELLQKDYPLSYEYLLSQKTILDGRDKGKPNPVSWYAYGRTQGLNRYGKKLLFPTFANSPRFMLVKDEDALFCNGYAVFENEYISLDILQKILNSRIMQYYISSTSYAIEGGYYCYQKKYIERFSIPFLTEDDKAKIRKLTESELDAFLTEMYSIIE